LPAIYYRRRYASMARVFDESVRLAKRIPTIQLVAYFLASVVCNAIHKDDRKELLEKMSNRVDEFTQKEVEEDSVI